MPQNPRRAPVAKVLLLPIIVIKGMRARAKTSPPVARFPTIRWTYIGYILPVRHGCSLRSFDMLNFFFLAFVTHHPTCRDSDIDTYHAPLVYT
jgi:hypothetical protein